MEEALKKRCRFNKGHTAPTTSTLSQHSPEKVQHLSGGIWNVRFGYGIAEKKKENAGPL